MPHWWRGLPVVRTPLSRAPAWSQATATPTAKIFILSDDTIICSRNFQGNGRRAMECCDHRTLRVHATCRAFGETWIKISHVVIPGPIAVEVQVNWERIQCSQGYRGEPVGTAREPDAPDQSTNIESWENPVIYKVISTWTLDRNTKEAWPKRSFTFKLWLAVVLFLQQM